MNNLFNPDNRFFVFMGRVADLMMLNFICILCCLPIVTAGASITAMYYVTLKMARNDESYIIRGFFHSFRQNLKQGIVIHLIMLIVGILLLFDLYFARFMQSESKLYTALAIIFMIGLILYMMILTYVYPVLSKFYNSIKNTFRNAFLMSIRHFPYTLLLLAISIVPLVLMIFVTPAFPIILFLYLIIGFAFISLAQSMIFVKIFDKYIPEAEETVEETVSDIDGSVFANLQPISEEELEARKAAREAAMEASADQDNTTDESSAAPADESNE